MMEQATSPLFDAAKPCLRALTLHRTRDLRAPDGLRPLRHQLPPRDVQVDQREQPDDLAGVLRQAPVSHLDVAELPLQYAERMFDATTNLRDDAIELCRCFGLRDTGGAPDRHAVEGSDAFDGLMHAGIVEPTITEDMVFLAMQQVLGLSAIGDLRRRRSKGMNQSALAVSTDVEPMGSGLFRSPVSDDPWWLLAGCMIREPLAFAERRVPAGLQPFNFTKLAVSSGRCIDRLNPHLHLPLEPERRAWQLRVGSASSMTLRPAVRRR